MKLFFNYFFLFLNDKTPLFKNRIAKENEKVPEVLKAQHLHHENRGMFKCFHDIKGRGPGINRSQSKKCWENSLSMQILHLSIFFENIWF